MKYCNWTAITTFGLDTVLTVKGICEEPTPGYKLSLKRVDLQEGDPNALYLVLRATAPAGIEPQVVTPTPVEYTQAFVVPRQHVPKRVNILTLIEDESIQVQPFEPVL
jgi:hypothetical protein